MHIMRKLSQRQPLVDAADSAKLRGCCRRKMPPLGALSEFSQSSLRVLSDGRFDSHHHIRPIVNHPVQALPRMHSLHPLSDPINRPPTACPVTWTSVDLQPLRRCGQETDMNEAELVQSASDAGEQGHLLQFRKSNSVAPTTAPSSDHFHSRTPSSACTYTFRSHLSGCPLKIQ